MGFLFSLLLFPAITMAAPPQIPWYEAIRKLGQETAESKRLLKELKADKNLGLKVSQSLKAAEHEPEAVEAVMRFHLDSCWPDVLQLTEDKPSWLSIQALDSLNAHTPHPEWKKWVRDTILAETWPALEWPEKLALVNSAVDAEIVFNANELKSLFREASDQVRTFSLRLLTLAIQKNPKDADLKALLKICLKLQPYQFRVEAFDLISKLPSSVRGEFKSVVANCVKSESNDEVKSVCVDLQKSL
jgi:hypothetical protein